MLRYYESVRGMEGGHSVNGYIEGFARDFFTNLSLAERRQVLAAGENFPTSALSILAKLPDNPGADVLADIRALDQRVATREGEPMARLRVGTIAVFGASGDPKSLAYLRSVYQSQPERRAPVATSLAQYPRRRKLGHPGRFAANGRRHGSPRSSHRARARQSPAKDIPSPIAMRFCKA